MGILVPEPPPGALPRVLCVDDDPHVLEGLARYLRRRVDLVLAVGGPAALEIIERDRSFAVVMSDLRMPGADGIAVLGRVRKVAPDTVRLLLTGHADLRAAIAAVNEGQIFRFLQKPASPEVVLAAIAAAVEQYELRTAERVLLERTLQGSIKALVDVLALANPAAFGRASRAKRMVSDLASLIGLRDRWQFEIAAMLSQIGCITLPPSTVDRLYHGHDLDPGERELVARLPQVAVRLLAEIPRLEGVREILQHQNDRFEGMLRSGSPDTTDALGQRHGEDIPLGSRLLKAVLDFDELLTQGHNAAAALGRLRARHGVYDPDVLSDLVSVCGVQPTLDLVELRLADVKVGMTFADDVIDGHGTLLVARGQDVTAGLVDRIENYWDSIVVSKLVHVHCLPTLPAAPASPETVVPRLA